MADEGEVLKVERLGGLAGFGNPGSPLKSRGELALADLAAADREAVDALFAGRGGKRAGVPDGFRYRLTHVSARGERTIEVHEAAVPAAVARCVRDTLD